MVKQINVLVTGSGSLYGVAIVQCLMKGSLNCRVVCCDSDPMALGLYLADTGYLVPPVKEKEKWLAKIIAICKREGIQCIFIGSSQEIKSFAENKDYIDSSVGAKVFIHSFAVMKLCLDKWQTVMFLKEQGFYYPQTLRYPEDMSLLEEFIAKTGFPIVAKPRVGAGSEGLAVLSNEQQLSKFIKNKQNYIIQEYLPDDDGEFTVGVCLGSGGTVLSSIALKRNLQDGMTISALADAYSDICLYCEKVAKTLGTYGPCNLQLRMKQGVPYIFEINPRFSSSTGMRIALGVKEPELLIRSEILGQKVEKPRVSKAGVIRQYTDYVIPIEQINKFTSSKLF